jgi:fatty-acid peroxygenase
MSDQRGQHLDDTMGLVMQGYARLPQLWRRAGGVTLHTRVLGRRSEVAGPGVTVCMIDAISVGRCSVSPVPV